MRTKLTTAAHLQRLSSTSIAPLCAIAMLLYSSTLNANQELTEPPIHDPVITKHEYRYYLYGTGQGISVFSSSNLKDWTPEPSVFTKSQIPAWAFGVTPDFEGHIWAPDIYEHEGTYYLYYSISSGGKNTSAIGVATNTTLNPDARSYQWVDHGPVIHSVPYRDLWNAIDPHIIEDEDGTPWMSFGSFWGGLKLVKLASNRIELAKPEVWHSIAKRERSIFVDDAEPEPAALEAPFIFKKGDYYYLFVSWDYCCRGNDSTYKIMVGRSKELTGPYVDKKGDALARGAGSLVLAGNDRYAGVGHNSAYHFDGEDYLVFHAYDRKESGESFLKMLPIKWRNGWPEVDAGAL